MTLQLSLPAELEERLRHEAERRGQPAESVAVQVLDQNLPPAARPAAAVAMLERWMKEDAELSPAEEADNALVLRALDDDRPSFRKLFAELQQDFLK